MLTHYQARAIALVAALAALLGILGWQESRVLSAKEDLANEKAAHQADERRHAEELATAQGKARKTESDLRAELDDQQAKADKEKEDAKAREDALVERVRAGNLRLSIAAHCPAAQPAGGSSAPAGGGGATLQRAELDPAAAERIIGITRDGDDAIRERNACIEAYESVRAKLNAGAAQ